MSLPAEKTSSPSVIDLDSRRHRRVLPALTPVNLEEAGDDEVGDAANMIAILAEALEAIAECTNDAGARRIASEALVLFHGR